MIDIHTHSTFSPDGHDTMASLCASAVSQGLSGLAFAEHGEWIPEDEGYEYLRPAAYFDALDRLRAQYQGQLMLLAGVEAGNLHEFPDEVAAFLRAWPWDIVIGSLHWVGDTLGCTPPAFEDGIDAWYTRFYTELITLTAESDFDILGHLELPRRDSWLILRQSLPAAPYADLIRQSLRNIIARGKALEVNTSGWRKGLTEPVPGLTVLRWYRELGGDLLVIGSDAHRASDVGRDFDRARALALEAGFTRLARFEQRSIVGWIEL